MRQERALQRWRWGGFDELFFTFDLLFELYFSFPQGLFLDLNCLCRGCLSAKVSPSFPALWPFPPLPVFPELLPFSGHQAGGSSTWPGRPFTTSAGAPPAARNCYDHWAEGSVRGLIRFSSHGLQTVANN